MRFLLLAATAVGVLAIQPAHAQRRCASPADQAVFEVQALRSQLMVLATGCGEDARYNAFMGQYKSDVLANARAVEAYFKRKFGRAAQHEHDRFVTDLANAVSRESTRLGGDFCPRNGMIFNEVMALRSPADLPGYAAGKDLVPATIDICQEPATSAPAKGHKPETHAVRK